MAIQKVDVKNRISKLINKNNNNFGEINKIKDIVKDSVSVNHVDKDIIEFVDLNANNESRTIQDMENGRAIEKITNLKQQYIKEQENKAHAISYGNQVIYPKIDRIPENYGKSVRKVSGDISPGTTNYTFIAKPYQLNSEDYNRLVALVYSEAVEHNNYLVSDTMGVTSVVLNRIESSDFDKINNIDDILNSNEFDGYNKDKYDEAIKDISVVKGEMIKSINRVLDGERNTKALYFNGMNTYNSFY